MTLFTQGDAHDLPCSVITSELVIIGRCEDLTNGAEQLMYFSAQYEHLIRELWLVVIRMISIHILIAERETICFLRQRQ